MGKEIAQDIRFGLRDLRKEDDFDRLGVCGILGQNRKSREAAPIDTFFLRITAPRQLLEKGAINLFVITRPEASDSLGTFNRK